MILHKRTDAWNFSWGPEKIFNQLTKIQECPLDFIDWGRKVTIFFLQLKVLKLKMN